MGNAMDGTYETDKTNGTGAAGAGAPRRAPELLAPAGGPDAGYAALQYGADAVYLGLKAFSARAEADNFDFVALDEFTTYAHSLPRPRRVYAAVNTLVQEREFPALRAALGRLAAARVDAAIVQDLGVARVLLADFPEIRLHVSTQMAVHDVETARFFARLGARRVTLARELTLPEIREIAAIPGLEAEFFLHGALCYSYSGLCLFSSHLMGRSANRGRCAYPCRDFFAVDGDPARAGHLFSMKDLALWRELPQLFATGVASLKIEGRKKSPLYVAAGSIFTGGSSTPAPPGRSLTPRSCKQGWSVCKASSAGRRARFSSGTPTAARSSTPPTSAIAGPPPGRWQKWRRTAAAFACASAPPCRWSATTVCSWASPGRGGPTASRWTRWR